MSFDSHTDHRPLTTDPLSTEEWRMNELKAICEAFAEGQKRGKRSALATIVHTSGSTYRRASARMIVTEEGRTAGSISGGCLESDVIKRSLAVINSGRPEVVNYDTRSNDDVLWGSGLGCQGVVEILIESLSNEECADAHIDFIGQCLRGRETGVVATVIGVGASTQGVKVGDRLALTASGVKSNRIGDTALASQVLEDAMSALASAVSGMKLYGSPERGVAVFIEVIEPPPPLVIFGAEPDAVPVTRFAQALGWHVTIVDTRARVATKERFLKADDVVLCGLEDVSGRVEIGPRTAVVLMSHDYLHDLALLELSLSSPARYIGVLGPRKRTEKLIKEIIDGKYSEGERSPWAAGAIDVGRIHSPAGIDIGAGSPAEIALSIVAEIMAVLASRSGAFLKDRRGSIHNASSNRNVSS
jgi:xanthine dehydrogenase accessory factor